MMIPQKKKKMSQEEYHKKIRTKFFVLSGLFILIYISEGNSERHL